MGALTAPGALSKPRGNYIGTHRTAQVIVDLNSGTQFAKIGHLCCTITILRDGAKLHSGAWWLRSIPIMTRSVTLLGIRARRTGRHARPTSLGLVLMYA